MKNLILIVCALGFASTGICGEKIESQGKAYELGVSYFFGKKASKIEQNTFWKSKNDSTCRVHAIHTRSGETKNNDKILLIQITTSDDFGYYPAYTSLRSNPSAINSQQASFQKRDWSKWMDLSAGEKQEDEYVFNSVTHNYMSDPYPMVGTNFSRLNAVKNAQGEIVEARIEYVHKSDYELKGDDYCYELEKTIEFNLAEVKKLFQQAVNNPKLTAIPAGCKLSKNLGNYARCVQNSNDNEVTCQWPYQKFTNASEKDICSVKPTDSFTLKVVVVPNAQKQPVFKSMLLK